MFVTDTCLNVWLWVKSVSQSNGGLDVRDKTTLRAHGGLDVRDKTTLCAHGGLDMWDNTTLCAHGGLDMWDNTTLCVHGGLDMWDNTTLCVHGCVRQYHIVCAWICELGLLLDVWLQLVEGKKSSSVFDVLDKVL